MLKQVLRKSNLKYVLSRVAAVDFEHQPFYDLDYIEG